MNSKRSLESQFLVAFLSFTGLLYLNVWRLRCMPRVREAAPQEWVETSAAPDFANWDRNQVAQYLISDVTRQLNQSKPYLASAVQATDVQPSLTPIPSLLQISRCNIPQQLLR